MTDTSYTFAEMIIQLRKDYNMTLTEFASLIGISAQYLCDLERKRRLPSVRVVHNICDHFIVGRGLVTARRVWHSAGARAHGWEVA